MTEITPAMIAAAVTVLEESGGCEEPFNHAWARSVVEEMLAAALEQRESEMLRDLIQYGIAARLNDRRVHPKDLFLDHQGSADPFNITPLPHVDDPEHWSHQGADYDGTDCANCGRQRVLLYANGRRICEKCNWDQEQADYAADHARIG